MNLNYSKFTDKGFIRDNNEDSLGFYQNEDEIIAVVCDGVGGNEGGEIASELSKNAIIKLISGSIEEITDNNFDELFNKVNQEVIKTSFIKKFYGMATTMEVVYLKQNLMYWGHIGDSRIYLYRNKKLTQVTKDHSLVQNMIDKGMITEKEAMNHPQRNIITKALGIENLVVPDAGKIKLDLSEEFKILLCSDGICSVINNNIIENIMSQDNLDVITNLLIKHTELKGAPDNFTFIILSNEK